MQEAQRLAALSVRRVLDGATLTAALAAFAPPKSDSQGRRSALVQELAYGVLRHWGTLDALVRALAAKSFPDPALRCLVAVAIYQLEHTRAPPFAVVDHAVNAAAVIARPAAKSLVNALLRRFLRERDTLNASVVADPVARWSHPQWWIDLVRRDFPDDWELVLAAGNVRGPLALRINPQVTTRNAVLLAFAGAGVCATPVGEAGIIVEPPKAVRELPGYRDGAFSVQDPGAQLAAPLLRLSPGQHVLDACAAPGGKTTHIAELAEVELVALDNDQTRLERVRENLDRLRLAGPRVRVVAGDAEFPSRWWNGRPFDRILADVPCTASGVVRRHPDVKWLRRAADIESFSRRQARLLDALWACLAEKGLLLYATCSIFAEENEAQITEFAARHPEALRETITLPKEAARHGSQLLPSLPGACHNQDGFFYALLRKP